MSPSILRIEIVSPSLVEITAQPHELGALSEFFSENGLLAMRQSDCVVVEGCWRNILNVLSGFEGDACLGGVNAQEPAASA